MSTTTPQEATTCDLLVIGSGAGGLSAAVTAAWHDLKVIVAEKEPVFGGTTAWSGGWMWIPGNPLAKRAGIDEDPAAFRTYLQHELGNHYDETIIEAYLRTGPEMVTFFEEHTAVRFVDGNRVPDFHGHTPAAGTGGRSVCAAPYDGRQLGSLLGRLRPPLTEITFMGMGIAAGADLGHFLNVTRSLPSALHVARRFGKHLIDLALHRRGMQLVNGNALVARLLKSAADLGVQLWEAAPAQRLLIENGAVRGAVLATAAGERTVHARHGTLLACGGFPHDAARQQRLFPHAAMGQRHWSAAPRTNTGDGLRLGETAGGHVDEALAAPAAWAPVSLVPRGDGTFGHFPHLIERAKPGLIAVRADGRRFANEADSYHDVMGALLAATGPGEEVAAWLVCDHRFQRRYGLGFAKPAPLPLLPYLRSGYLKRGATLGELARACGIDAAGLEQTVATFNRDAERGEDPAFGRGSTAYNRIQGDAGHGPNPCVAPIAQGPFYAVKIVPGSLGTFAGLRTDAFARVLGQDGQPIPGLYAGGNDMAAVLGGTYPAGGITLGPAMTFGYIAARHAAGLADRTHAAAAA